MNSLIRISVALLLTAAAHGSGSLEVPADVASVGAEMASVAVRQYGIREDPKTGRLVRVGSGRFEESRRRG
jgi:hypothetical protein